MDSLRPDRLLDMLTSTKVVVGVLWLGLAALTITLLVLTRTRWGQSRPLRKCVVLSLLAHLLLIGYATTVRFVASTPLEAQGPVMRVSIAEEDSEPREITEEATARDKPWESFADESVAGPGPVEPDRARPLASKQLERQTAPEPGDLAVEPALENLEFNDAVQPEPESRVAEAPADGPRFRPSAEPIQAPKPQRRQDVQVEAPPAPEIARQGVAEAPSPEPGHKGRAGLPSALVDLPRPVPRMREAPAVPEPRDSLRGMINVLPSPAHGNPADPPSERLLAKDPSPPKAASGTRVGREGTGADPLRPPSFATQDDRERIAKTQMGAIPKGSGDVGPPGLPMARPAGGDREMPNIYKLRVARDRSQLAERMGASPETEEAVRAALKWLADTQEPDGRWSAKAHGGGRESIVLGRDRKSAGSQADSGMTGLALLAFLASGHTHKEGIYRSNVQRGLQYLMRVQKSDGGLGGRATTFAYMYCHAMATFALSEAYGMTGDSRLREPVRRAAYRTLSVQNATSGGWRYYPGDPGDTSQLGWQLMALKSAQLAGIPIPDSARQGATRFLASVSSGHYGGLAAYRPGETVSRPMTAEALACRLFLGMHPGHPTAREAGDYLLGELPGQGTKNLYYWYYGTLAMYQLQGDPWRRWNRALQKTLLPSQKKSGPIAGSWDPNTVWGGYGGRVYSTALAALCLEVYYRFLPFYIEVASKGRLTK